MSGNSSEEGKAEETGELSYLEKSTLLALQELDGEASPEEIAEHGEADEEVKVMNAVSWLNSKELVFVEEEVKHYYSLAKKSLAKKDLPERKALKFLDKEGGRCSVSELQEKSDLGKKKAGIALGWLKDKGWAEIVKEKGGSYLQITKKGREALKEKGRDEKLIRRLGKEGKLPEEELDEYTINNLLSRKEILEEDKEVLRTVKLTEKGKEELEKGLELRPQINQLTPEIIRTGAWKDARIRPYDVKAYAPKEYGGKRHPIKREMEKVRQVFLEMGFTEMKSDVIQPAFWNFDALFSPQDHPARDLQDTFYLERPGELDIDEEIAERVKNIHKNGGDTRSKGWQYDWSEEEARKAVLRTHTTAASIRYLSENDEPPVKAFSVDWNYRSEKPDSTHLSEFVQIEGIVMEENASLNMLIGFMKEFYRKMGFEDVKVRPGYFPFTEPSLEVFAKWKDQYLEMGGAGLFRREVLEPHGIEEPVIAWGLGLERLVMLRLGWEDIRECYRNDIERLREYPLL
ncbi:MAG: phenylalanine--tRNA ligase subunit alpha [Candidatus Thermoplasmatota archaeon]|nr:phenylalanine--tRNA ligase subunit alpha [Candidatus Thermoplasmatota archaeon]